MNKLLLERPGCEETVKVGAQKLGDKIAAPKVNRKQTELKIIELTDPQEER